MSKEVHSGPTDETQARGTPYSGDPQGGAGTQPEQLEKLPLDGWHRQNGARMVPFAGYEMPVQYEGIMAETVKYPGHNGDMLISYYARPLGPGPFPGVVVIHPAPGWDEWAVRVPGARVAGARTRIELAGRYASFRYWAYQ